MDKVARDKVASTKDHLVLKILKILLKKSHNCHQIGTLIEIGTLIDFVQIGTFS
jgi:hypothetical protein